MGTLLQLLNLTDRYERKARLLPAVIVVLPLAIAVASLVGLQADWYSALGAGALFEGVLGVGLSHLARIPGTTFGEKLATQWGGQPTHRWLRPGDVAHSEAQKSRWRGAIRTLTGLTVPATAGTKTAEEIDKLIDDAVRQLRNRLREEPAARMVTVHNEDYGFARNLGGLRWAWVAFSVLGAGACGLGLYLGRGHLLAMVVEVGFALISGCVLFALPEYVRHCADRYAESLFAAAITVADGLDRQHAASKPATA